MVKVRVVDYIVNKINELGVEHVFTITGGGAMFLNDAVLRHPNVSAICGHHEQASAMSAVGYSKYSGKLGVVMPTTGCGATNTLTGLLDGWQDNVPMLFISGQVNSHQTMDNYDIPLRQIGVQEADIVKIVESITKYAVMVKKSTEIRYHLEKAIHEAFSGRPGPVWLDLPLDIQSAMIDPDELKPFVPEKEERTQKFSEITELFSNASRPVILVGNGVRLAGAEKEFEEYVNKYQIPVVNTYLAADLLPTDNPLNIGRVGIKGNRAANFALQNADLVLAIGTRLGVPVTGYKCPDSWRETCVNWKEKWPVYLPEHDDDSDGISFYRFMKSLSETSRSDDVFVSDAGSAYYVASQAVHIRDEQRYITSGAQADMGFTLPACIGVSVSNNFKPVVGIVGDGSFQLNIQELQTMVHNKIPVKMFVWNNNGYLSIRTTQRKFFDDGFIGTDVKSGVSFPELEKIADAYGVSYTKATKVKKLNEVITETLETDGPVICEVMCKEWDAVLPTIGSKKLPNGKMFSRPLEDMFPFLTREEFYSNMIVKPLKEN
jgi:acetolactate synthase-1/2/3 large subunit